MFTGSECPHPGQGLRRVTVSRRGSSKMSLCRNNRSRPQSAQGKPTRCSASATGGKATPLAPGPARPARRARPKLQNILVQRRQDGPGAPAGQLQVSRVPDLLYGRLRRRRHQRRMSRRRLGGSASWSSRPPGHRPGRGAPNASPSTMGLCRSVTPAVCRRPAPRPSAPPGARPPAATPWRERHAAASAAPGVQPLAGRPSVPLVRPRAAELLGCWGGTTERQRKELRRRLAA
jgi:hypothetical protein